MRHRAHQSRTLSWRGSIHGSLLRLSVILLAAPLWLWASPVRATITPTSNAADLANAIAQNPALVTGAAFVTIPPSGTPEGIEDSSLAGFPTDGSTFGILTTGDASLADQPNCCTSSGTDDLGGTVRGNTDFDVSILRIDLNVPSGANCLSFDFRFLSEEYPEFVGSPFNDGFIAELDASTWTTNGSTITAPDNFAFDPVGNVISINAAGVTSMTADAAAGTTYDGATPTLRASTPVTPGAHSLFLSIFDQGDRDYDSAAFLDRLVIGATGPGGCQTGATVLTVSKTTSTPVVAAGAKAIYTIQVHNPGGVEATLTSITDTLPAGFSYGAGTTIGITAADPTVSGQDVTWTGPFTLGGASSVSLTFSAVVSTIPGDYLNNASATATGVAVTQSGPTAEVVVIANTSTPTETASLTATATSSPTPSPTDTATPSETPTFTLTATGIPTDTPTVTPTDTLTATPTATATDTPTSTPSVSPTEVPVLSPTPTETASVTATVTSSPTPSPTETATASGTPPFTPSAAPTATSTAAATATVPAVANDTCNAATVITSATFSESQMTSAATTEAGYPVPVCGNSSRRKSVWYWFTAPADGTLTADTFGSSYDTILSTYTTSTCRTFDVVPSGCNNDASGGKQSRVSFQAHATSKYYFMITAFNDDGGTLRFNLAFQATGATVTPTALSAPTATDTPVLATTPESTSTPTATTAPPASTETPTREPTSTLPFTPTPTSSAAPTVTVTPVATPTATPTAGVVANDTCGDATVVAETPYMNIQTTNTATTEPGYPVPVCGNASRRKSVWYRFTPTRDGTLTAGTFGSDYDTILSVYTGVCGAFRPVRGGCNNDAGGGKQSQVSFAAKAGTTYDFMITAFADDGGTLVFSVTP